jgi:hypothetical protein
MSKPTIGSSVSRWEAAQQIRLSCMTPQDVLVVRPLVLYPH